MTLQLQPVLTQHPFSRDHVSTPSPPGRTAVASHEHYTYTIIALLLASPQSIILQFLNVLLALSESVVCCEQAHDTTNELHPTESIARLISHPHEEVPSSEVAESPESASENALLDGDTDPLLSAEDDDDDEDEDHDEALAERLSS